MALNAQQVESLQNASPTDWNKLDQQLADRSNWDTNRFAMDKNLHVRFYMKPRLNPDKSAEANRAIYEDTEYVEIMIPGDKHNIIQRPVWSQDIVRFGELYNKFKAGVDQVIGTPLAVVPFLTPAQVEEFGFFNIKTVEQLANLNDGIMGRFMGAHDLKAKAKAWLDSSTSGETLLKRIKELEEQLQAVKAHQDEEDAAPVVAPPKPAAVPAKK
jgi:hypothetical protein